MDNVASDFGHQKNFILYEVLYNANVFVPPVPFIRQYNHILPTPEKSLFVRSYASSGQSKNQSQMNNAEVVAPAPPPIGQGNAMLFTLASIMDMDDSFDFLLSLPSDGEFGGDFALFSSPDNTFMPAGKDNLFGEAPRSGTDLSQFATQGPWQDFYATQSTQTQGERHEDENLGMMDPQ